MKWESLSLVPDPPVGGSPAALYGLNGASPAPVTGGSGELYALLDGVILYTSPPTLTCGDTVSGRARGARACERARARALASTSRPPSPPRARDTRRRSRSRSASARSTSTR